MQIIKIEQFKELLQDKLNQKVDCYLQALLQQFGKFFKVAQEMIEYLIELDDYFNSIEFNNKPIQLINNAIHLLYQFFLEHTDFIQWNYCEQFLITGQERVTMIRANIHPIFHQFDQTKIKKSVCDILLGLQDKNSELSSQMTLLSNQINLHQIILKQKEEQFCKFYDMLQFIQQQLFNLQNDKIFQKYYQLLQKIIPFNEEFTKLLINCLNTSSQLITQLDIQIENCKLVRQIGKKNLKGNTHEIQLLMKYSSILINKECIWSQIHKQHFEDLTELSKILERQSFYKLNDQNQHFNTSELRTILIKKEQLFAQLHQDIKKEKLQNEWLNLQPLGLISLQQLNEQLGPMFGNLSTFVRVSNLYNTLKQDMGKFFDQNFQQIIHFENFQYII